jgi:hypothetical protein
LEDVHAVFEYFIDCTTLEFILPEVIDGLSDKLPTVKKHTCAFLEKIAQKTYIDEL